MPLKPSFGGVEGGDSLGVEKGGCFGGGEGMVVLSRW